MNPPRKILVIEPSNIGDAILAHPALASVARAYPQAQLHVLCSERVSGLLAVDPKIRKIWKIEKSDFWGRHLFLVTQLFSERFGLVIDFKHTLIPLFLLGAKRTPFSWRPSAPHRVKRYLELVERVGIPVIHGGVPLPYRKEEEVWAARQTDGRAFAVISPGARSHLKRWVASRFAQVADRLIEEKGIQVILVGEEAERPIADEVARSMRHPALDLSGQTTLPQMAALLHKAALVVTNDSASLHMADAMGRPTVAIFGPTDEKKYGPRSPHSKVVRRTLVCSPCELALCPYHHECMSHLPAEEVYGACMNVLNGGR